MILAVDFTSPSIEPTCCLSPSTTNSVSAAALSNSSIKLPRITSPTAPYPFPPKILTFGRPHLKTFPVLQSSSTSDIREFPSLSVAIDLNL